MKTSRLLAVALAVAAVSGCRCDPNTSALRPEYVANPTALAFEACPTKDETGRPVTDVFPDTQKVTISNRGKIGAGLKLSFTGLDTGAFKLGGTPPTALGALEEIELPVQFSPDKKGDLRAELVIDDEFENTPNQTVTLVGTGKNLPAQATIETAPQKQDKTGFLTCQDGSPLSDCTVEFPQTLYGESATMQLKIRNKGCPALKVTSLEIAGSSGGTEGFVIESPAQLPSATSPILLSTADGTDEITVTLRWTPEDDGSGNNFKSATLVVKSNDPLYGDGFAQPGRLVLSGEAIKPSIYTTPGLCDFSNAADLCGNTTKVTDRAKFRITNDGNSAVRLDTTKFGNGSSTASANSRFSIVTAVEGTVLQPTQGVDLLVAHTDAPLYVNDQLTVEASLQPGGATGSAGKVVINLFGGRKPCMTTDPLDQMNFQNPAAELTAQPLKIRNGATCGTLIVDSVAIDTNPFFSLIDPLIPAGTQIAAGGERETTVQYRRPASGGQQVGTLRIRSNDSDFGPPSYKLVQLLSDSPLDQVPVAAITGCIPANLLNDPQCSLGSTGSMSVNYSTITPKEVTVSGVNSYDPDPAAPGGKKAVTGYRFKLLPPFPSGVTTAALAGHDTKVATPTTKLTLPAGSTGLFRISLQVYDDRNQQSGNTAILNVNVYP